MKEIGAFEAKTHLSRLLEEVAAGAEFLISRRGVPIAKLVPLQSDEAGPLKAAARLKQLRANLAARGVAVTQTEIRGWIDEGRR